jgi:Ca2+-binding EF-hand superfamily protein
MRINPKLANLQYMYANGDTTSALPEGTYSNLAATKYLKDNDKNKDKCLTTDEVTLSQEAFDRLDQDKNGKIELSEMKTALKGQDEAIQAYYSKKGTKSSSTDLTSSLLGDTTGSLADIYANLAAAKYIKENDTDKSEALSSAESGLTQTAFDRLDTNKDGKLSLAEIRAGLEGQEGAVEDFYEDNATTSSVTSMLSGLLEKAPAQTTQTTAKYSTKAANTYLKDHDTDDDSSLSSAEAGLSATAFGKLDADKNGKLDASELQAALRAKEDKLGTYYKNNVSSSTLASYTSGLLKTV